MNSALLLAIGLRLSAEGIYKNTLFVEYGFLIAGRLRRDDVAVFLFYNLIDGNAFYLRLAICGVERKMSVTLGGEYQI